MSRREIGSKCLNRDGRPEVASALLTAATFLAGSIDWSESGATSAGDDERRAEPTKPPNPKGLAAEAPAGAVAPVWWSSDAAMLRARCKRVRATSYTNHEKSQNDSIV